MPTLHVRNVPDRVYSRIQKLAQTRNRSLSAQVITLLNQALDDEAARQRQARVLAGIRRRRFAPTRGAPDTTTLLREDRGR